MHSTTIHETQSIPLAALPPLALDKFAEESGLSPVTLWRYRKSGWLQTVNICGKHYVPRESVAEFNRRAAAGEFAKAPNQPKRKGAAE